MIQPRAPKKLNAKEESFAWSYSIVQGGETEVGRQTEERKGRGRRTMNAKLGN